MEGKEFPPPYQQHSGIYPKPLPPQPDYGPPSSAPVIHTTQVVVSSAVSPTPYLFGSEPITVACPHCHATIRTRVDTEANTKTHLFALLLCVFGCWPCCCLPYCMDSCQSKKHFCPNCGAYLATFSD